MRGWPSSRSPAVRCIPGVSFCNRRFRWSLQSCARAHPRRCNGGVSSGWIPSMPPGGAGPKTLRGLWSPPESTMHTTHWRTFAGCTRESRNGSRLDQGSASRPLPCPACGGPLPRLIKDSPAASSRSCWRVCTPMPAAFGPRRPSGCRAPEVLFVIGAALARILRLLRVGTQRARARRRPRGVADDDALRGVPGLDPLVEGRDRAEYERSVATATVAHARDQEQPRVPGLPPYMFGQRGIEIHRAHRRNQPVRQPVREQKLVATAEESIQPGGRDVEHGAACLHRTGDIFIVVEAAEIPLRVLEHHIAQIGEGGSEGLGPHRLEGKHRLASDLEAREDALAGARIVRPLIDRAQRGHLRTGETVRLVAGF